MKRVAQELARGTLTRERLIEIARGREPYFVPEGTALNVQLAHFQRNRRRLAFVVNEYGDIEGLVTLEDILEEIVGEFTTDPATITHKDMHTERPGRLHRQCQRHHPRAEPRAAAGSCRPMARRRINGLLLEQLETIPDSRHHGAGRGLRVRGAADRRQRDPHRARAAAGGAPSPPKRACLPERRTASSASLMRPTPVTLRVPSSGLARRVVLRHDGACLNPCFCASRRRSSP